MGKEFVSHVNPEEFTMNFDSIDKMIDLDEKKEDIVCSFLETSSGFKSALAQSLCLMAKTRTFFPRCPEICSIGQAKFMAHYAKGIAERMNAIYGDNLLYKQKKNEIDLISHEMIDAVTNMEMLMAYENSLEFSTVPEITHIAEYTLRYPLRVCVKSDGENFISRSLNVPCPAGTGDTISESVESLQKEFMQYWVSLKDSRVMSSDAYYARKQYCNILNVDLPDATIVDLEQPDDENIEDD